MPLIASGQNLFFPCKGERVRERATRPPEILPMPNAADLLTHDQTVTWLRRNGAPAATSSWLYRRNATGTGPVRYRCGTANGYAVADLVSWVAGGAGVRAKAVADGAITMTVSGTRGRVRPRVQAADGAQVAP